MGRFAGWLATGALAWALLSPAANAAAPARDAPGLEVHDLRVGNLTRQYWLHRPAQAAAGKSMPLVLVLHGGGGANASTMMARYDFDEIADREGFLLVYPYGVDGQWNDGRGASFRKNKDNSQVDDVGYIDAVIEDVARQEPVDRNRIYITGASNGGMMTFRLGIELGAKLAAIAPIIANIPANLIDKAPASPLPVLVMNGTDDPLVPWDGGPVRVFGKSHGDVVSTQRGVDYWLRANRLTAAPEQTWLPDTDLKDGCQVERLIYQAPANPNEVGLYALHGGGHNVPGAHTPNRPRLVGNKCMDINGAEVIWAFFARHALSDRARP